jgi:hypothetical protein
MSGEAPQLLSVIGKPWKKKLYPGVSELATDYDVGVS